MNEPLHGVVVVDKPVGPTSFAVVRDARRATGARKVGHGGTLDPLASGVLPICFGEATKLAQFLLDADKEYEAVVRFGAETDTYDAAGVITLQRPAQQLGADDVRRGLISFLGEQRQIPPMYSALKRDGRPLYAYARAGETVEREARPIHIHALDLLEFVPSPCLAESVGAAEEEGRGVGPGLGPDARLFVRCSKGTYVRSLAQDLGRALGTAAHLVALRRVRSGPFGLADAIAPEELTRASLPVITLADAIRHLPAVLVSEQVAREITQGKAVTWARAASISAAAEQGAPGGGAPIRILTASGELVAVARPPVGPDSPLLTLRVFGASQRGS